MFSDRQSARLAEQFCVVITKRSNVALLAQFYGSELTLAVLVRRVVDIREIPFQNDPGMRQRPERSRA